MKLLLLTRAFESLEMQRVQIEGQCGNSTSRAAIQSLGAHFEGILRNFSVGPGGISTDTAVYSIIREQWPEVRQTLVSRLQQPFRGGDGSNPQALSL